MWKISKIKYNRKLNFQNYLRKFFSPQAKINKIRPPAKNRIKSEMLYAVEVRKLDGVSAELQAEIWAWKSPDLPAERVAAGPDRGRRRGPPFWAPDLPA